MKISLGNYAPILKNASYLTVFEVMKMIMPFIALPYLFHVVGKNNYGTVVFAQSIIACFSLFINFGLDISAVRDVSIFRNDRKKLNEIFSSVIIIKSGLIVLMAIILLAMISSIPALEKISGLLYFAFLSCISDVLLPVWYYQGKENMKILTIVRFFSITFYTCTIFIFIREEADYPYIALLQSLGLILSALISCYFVFVKDKIRLCFPSVLYIKSTFCKSIPFFASRASLAMNSYMAKIMSGIFLTGSEVAAFDVAQKVVNGGMVPIQMLNQAIYPNLSRSQNKQPLWGIFRLVAAITFFVSIVIFLFSKEIVCILSDGELMQSVLLLRILCVYIFCSGFSVFFGTSVLVAFGYQKPFNLSVIYSTVVLLICYLLMIFLEYNSIYLYAIALLIAEFVVLGYRLYFVRKYSLLKIPDKK